MSARSNMRRVNPALGAFFLALLGACRVAAVDADPNPYSVIIEKNAFRLQPPPPPPAPTSETSDLPVVVFSGTEAIGSEIRVLLAVTPAEPRKNGQSATEAKEPTSYLTLTEGQTEGSLQLVRIHPDKEAIDILVSGTSKTLTMKDNGFAKGVSTAPPSVAPKPAGQRPGGPVSALVPSTQRQPGAPPVGGGAGMMAEGNRGDGGNSGTLVGGGGVTGGISQSPAGAVGRSSPDVSPGNGTIDRQLGVAPAGGYENAIANGGAGGNVGVLIGGGAGLGEVASSAPDPSGPPKNGYEDGYLYVNGVRFVAPIVNPLTALPYGAAPGVP